MHCCHPRLIRIWFLQKSVVFSRALLLARSDSTSHSAMSSGGLSVTSLFMHFWMFYAILSAQKKFHPKFFSPKIFLGEARRDTILPSISSFFNWLLHNCSCVCVFFSSNAMQLSPLNSSLFLSSWLVRIMRESLFPRFQQWRELETRNSERTFRDISAFLFAFDFVFFTSETS